MTQIYLISPPQIILNDFTEELKKALATGLIERFQLRLKNYSKNDLLKIAKDLKIICQKNNCLFIVNDDDQLALEVEADGVHLGIEDQRDQELILQIKKKYPKFIVGASCYDSRKLAIKAEEQGADYISFGAFFESSTKISRGKPTYDLLDWAKIALNKPIVAIGGINSHNCQELVKRKVDFLAVISSIWQDRQGVSQAIIKLQKSITATSKIS